MIYLMRHAQTIGNEKGYFQGRCNFPLTELGKNQAAFLSSQFKLKEFDYVISSSSQRCIDTFNISQQNFKYKEFIKTPLLLEMSFGFCEGLSIEEIKNQYHNNNFLLLNNSKFPGGENVPDMLNRAEVFKKLYKDILYNKNTLIVTHKLMGNAIKAILFNSSYSDFDFLGHLIYSTIDLNKQEIFNVNLKDYFNVNKN